MFESLWGAEDILALPKEAWAPRSADQDDRGHRWRTELDLLPPWLELPDQGQGRRRESSPAWRTGAAEHFIKAWTHAFGSLTQDQQRMYQEQFPAPPGEWRNWYAALEQYTMPIVEEGPSEAEVWSGRWQRFHKQMTDEEKARAFYRQFNPAQASSVSSHDLDLARLNPILRQRYGEDASSFRYGHCCPAPAQAPAARGAQGGGGCGYGGAPQATPLPAIPPPPTLPRHAAAALRVAALAEGKRETRRDQERQAVITLALAQSAARKAHAQHLRATRPGREAADREGEWRAAEALREASRESLRVAQEEREEEEGQRRELARALEEEQAALDLDVACYISHARSLIAACSPTSAHGQDARAGPGEEACAVGVLELEDGRQEMRGNWTNLAVDAPARTAVGVHGDVTYTLRCDLSRSSQQRTDRTSAA
eukprot:Tamp_14474.p1 GENE.Tamp_14474~~Tamp_14474.p1  ORF type:complete len:427 (-),score=66.89 Tamp_14474:304-1584(-)